MNIPDEDISVVECERLRARKLHFRQIGKGVGRLGMKDRDDIIPLLHVFPVPRHVLLQDLTLFPSDYIDNISGQRTRTSVIRFRRLPVWRPEELERARRKAQHISDLLDWK